MAGTDGQFPCRGGDSPSRYPADQGSRHLVAPRAYGGGTSRTARRCTIRAGPAERLTSGVATDRSGEPINRATTVRGGWNTGAGHEPLPPAVAPRRSPLPPVAALRPGRGHV